MTAPRIKEFPSGAWTVFERVPSGMWLVKLYGADGQLADKVRCDDYRMAREYLRAFNKIAKGEA